MFLCPLWVLRKREHITTANVRIERILEDGPFAGGYRAVCDLVGASGEGFTEDEALDDLTRALLERDRQRRGDFQ